MTIRTTTTPTTEAPTAKGPGPMVVVVTLDDQGDVVAECRPEPQAYSWPVVLTDADDRVVAWRLVLGLFPEDLEHAAEAIRSALGRSERLLRHAIDGHWLVLDETIVDPFLFDDLTRLDGAVRNRIYASLDAHRIISARQ